MAKIKILQLRDMLETGQVKRLKPIFWDIQCLHIDQSIQCVRIKTRQRIDTKIQQLQRL